MNELNNEVTQFLDELEHPLRDEIEQLRLIVLNAVNGLIENIKWNGPNYCFNNADRVTMKIHPPKAVQLIFHRGAKQQTAPSEKLIQDPFGFLIWKGNDRAVLTVKSMAEIEHRKADIELIVKEWIMATS